MSWAFDHFDSHFPWKQFPLTERHSGVSLPTSQLVGDEGASSETRSAAVSPRSVNRLLLVRSDGQPVYEQREQ